MVKWLWVICFFCSEGYLNYATNDNYSALGCMSDDYGF